MKPMKPVKPNIGGQAVIEGVMMRGPKMTAIAVRKGSQIIIKKEENWSLSDKYKILKAPIIRGMLSLIEMLVIGIQALSYSAGIVGEEEEQLTKKDITIAIVSALGFAVLLFIIIPTVAVKGIGSTITNPLWLNFLEGLVRIIIFLVYLFTISRMKDIRRVFEYHGAEHKTVHCYENNEKLTVENVRKYKTLHPRCGTSFLMIVMIISILLFSLFGWPGPVARIVSRILLLPLVAGISYEFIRIAGSERFPLIKVLNVPGIWLQMLTTREPDDMQIETAIEALKCVS
jgi:uncharacterized protein YqhQ